MRTQYAKSLYCISVSSYNVPVNNTFRMLLRIRFFRNLEKSSCHIMESMSQ